MKNLFTLSAVVLALSCILSPQAHAQFQFQPQSQTQSQIQVPTRDAGLTISISPTRVEINPGHVTTCSELDVVAKPPGDDGSDEGNDGSSYPFIPHPVVAKLSVQSAAHPLDHTPVIGALRFPSFTLDHTFARKIRLNYAIVKISLPDQDFEFTLSDSEISNLLAIDSSLVINGPAHIVSNDAHDVNRQPSSPYAPCGLAVNGIPITTPGVGFVVPVEVRVTAYPMDPNGDQSEFEISTNGEAEYLP